MGGGGGGGGYWRDHAQTKKGPFMSETLCAEHRFTDLHTELGSKNRAFRGLCAMPGAIPDGRKWASTPTRAAMRACFDVSHNGAGHLARAGCRFGRWTRLVPVDVAGAARGAAALRHVHQ